MNETQENPFAMAAPNTAPAAMPAVVAAPSDPSKVSSLGKWAFEHKASFSKQNPLAWYGVRNVMSNMVGIAGLIGVIVGVRKTMGHGAQWAEKKGYDFLSNELSRTYTQNAIGIGTSFATFRTLYKDCQRLYDDVFVRPQSAEDASKAVSDAPKKFLQNFKQIGIVEYPVTMIGGFVLAGIRSGIAGVPLPAATQAKKKFSEIIRDKHTQRDIAGCAFFAYPAFFEIIEHMGGAWQKQRGYDDPYHNEHLNKHKTGMKELFTRQIPAVASGIIPYIAFNTWGYQTTGLRQQSYHTGQRAPGAKVDSFAAGYKKEMPFQFFWMYTLGRDLYYDAYDKLTGKAKEPGTHAQAQPSAHGLHSGHGAHGAVSETVPTAKVEAVTEHSKVADAKQHAVA